LFEQKERRLSLPSTGHYALIGDNVSNSIRYDHTCAMMKPRYNCAKKEFRKELGSLPTDWKLVLHHEDSDQSCDLWEFIHDIGGPVGVAQKLIQQRTMEGKITYHNDNYEDPVVVLMHGNSFLRQIFEALICGWSTDITNLHVQTNAKYDISHEQMAKRKGAKVRVDELGNFTSMRKRSEECHPNEKIKFFFEEGVSLPLTCSGDELYDDNIAMVEFGGKIKFYYIYRHYIYANVEYIHQEMLNLNPKKIDHLVFNDGEEKRFQKITGLKHAFEESGAWQKKIILNLDDFQEMQTKDIGKWFGADNPWIDNPPDIHPCMPGIPDDEANLLLFLLYSNATLV